MNQKNPGMSLVVTCYNRARFIGESIISCITQDYDGPIQIIIVDDASSDNSVEIIENTIKEHGAGVDIEVVKLKNNRGVAGATDAGWEKAKYEWILMVDGDDIQHPLRCQYISDTIAEHPDVLGISFCVKNIDINGNVTGVSTYASGYNYRDVPYETVLDTPIKNYQNWFASSKQRSVRCVGGAYAKKIYDLWGPMCQGEMKDARFEQDSVMAFRAALGSKVMGKKQIALFYRSHNDNLSNISLKKGYKGIVQLELFQDSYQAFHAETLRCKLLDVTRAESERKLTNWPPELLKQAKINLLKELAGCEMRNGWWKCSWLTRVRRALYYYKKCSAEDKVWVRLLPFHLFCLLKYISQCLHNRRKSGFVE